MSDLISRQAAIDALWKALYAYEDKTEKQFIESDELDINDWIQHRIFVQNMSDIDRQTIQNLPTIEAEPKHAYVIVDEDGNMECSNCGSTNCFDNYCGNCGAKLMGTRKDGGENGSCD